MNIKSVIDRVDELAPNGYTQEQKIKWLSSLDNLIYEKIIKTHHYNGAKYESTADFPDVGQYGVAYLYGDGGVKYWNGSEYADTRSFTPYTGETNVYATHLIADEAFSDMYLYWLFAQIDLANREYNGYNNNVSLYDAKYQDYATWYNRTHMPITTAREVYF